MCGVESVAIALLSELVAIDSMNPELARGDLGAPGGGGVRAD